MKRVFLSYAREDEGVAKEVYARLVASNVEVWFDQETLMPGERWKDKIRAAIEGCSYFLFLLSENSLSKRGYVQSEVRAALDIASELPQDRIYLIPARVEHCVPADDRFREIQWVDLYPVLDDGIAKLLRVIRRKRADNPQVSGVSGKVEEAEQGGSTKKLGVVEFFDPVKCFGKIRPESGEDLVFVHISNVVDKSVRRLVDGEQVRFEEVPDDRGPVAKKVERIEARFTGTVVNFSKKRGTGTIVTDDGDVELFVHYSGIVSKKSYKSLEEGERVEFSMAKGSGGRHKAVRVTVDGRMPLEKFAILPRFGDKLSQLARLAQKEDWGYKYTETEREFPILWSYLHYTFKRLEEEGKIAFAENPERKEKMSCFNTGLVTKYYEPIYAALHENKHRHQDAPWVLMGFYTESEHPITLFSEHPETADYFVDPVDLLYDRRIKLVKNVHHIIEDRLERFPEKFQDDPRQLANTLNTAVGQAEQKVLRNYKTAIPQFNRGKIQLLLPLCLEDPSQADLALVVGKEGAVYKGYTVLTLDMAYNNARLLTRPDDEWLIP